MRIIRTVVALIALFAPVTPQIALAASDQNSNETQIKFKIEENLKIENGIIKHNRFGSVPFNFEGYIPLKTPRELEIEKALNKYQAQRERAGYPQGKFVINASAYTAAADECGKSDGVTASGIMVKENETIACPPQFPFGTRLAIDGMGIYICEDRGGAIKGNHVDIYMETKREAFEFGRRDLLAEVVM